MPAGTFSVTISGAAENLGVSGDIDVNVSASAGMKTVTINGAGAGTTIITASTGERVFDVHAVNNPGSITFNLGGVTISGTTIASASGAALLLGRAGDITNISNCVFSGNSAPNSGAISQSSSLVAHDLTVTNCTFTNNTATSGGPGALNYNGIGNVTITGCTFSGNTAATQGGAINISGNGTGPVTTNILRNTFLNNTANGTQFGGAAVAVNNAQTVNINFNRLVGNTSPNLVTVATPPNNGDGRVITATGGVISSLNVDNNWWGVNTGPVTTATSRSVFGATPTRWLNLRNTASPSPICVGATSTITASFLSNNLSEAIAAANLTALVGQPITFNTPVNGTLSAAQTTIQAAGSATVTFTATGTGAGSANAVFVPATENFTVTTSPTIAITAANTAAAPSSNPTVCVNTAISPNITIATTGATGITNNGVSGANGLPAGVSASFAGNTITISGTPTTNVGSPFNYSIPLTGGCGSVNATGTITVNAVNTAAAPSSNPTVCVNTAISPNITIATTGATGITNNGVSGANGLPAGVSASFAGNTITISGTPTTNVGSPFNYSIPLTGGCGSVNATGTITVSATNTVTLSSGAGTNNQTVNISTAMTPITFSTTGATGISNNGVAGANGLPPGVTATWAANAITINGTPSSAAGSPYNYSISLTGGCGTVTATGTITVNAVLCAITLSSAAGTNAQTVCLNSAITNITYTNTAGQGATNATFAGLPIGVNGAWVGNLVTISGSPTTTVGSPFNYTVTLVGGSCEGTTATGSITVNPNNTITLTSAPATTSQTVCLNTPVTNIIYTTTGATGATFNGLPAGVTGNWAGNVVTISGSPSTTVGSPFTYTVTLTGGCGVVTATGTITVTPNNTITLTSAPATTSQTVCVNTAITNITYSTTGATGASFSGLPTGVSGAWAANMVTISGSPSTTLGSPFSYTVTLTGGCGIVSTTGTITVDPTNTITLTSAPATTSQTVCVNTAITNITYSTTGATGATFSGLPTGVSGAWAANVVTISGSPSTTVGSPFSYTVNLTGGCGSVNATGTITVTPNNIAGAPSSNPTVCVNTAISPNITIATTGATGIGAATGLPTGVSAVWAANVITISGTPTTTVGSPFNYSIPLTGGCGTVNATGTITVNPVTSLVSQPVTASLVCAGSSVVASVSAVGTGTLTYQWYKDSFSTPVASQTAATLTLSNVQTSDAGSYSVVVTGSCGSVTSTAFSLTVNSPLGITAQPVASSVVCAGATVSASVSVTGTGPYSYQWYKGFSTPVASQTASTLTLSNVQTSDAGSYSVVVTGSCGSVTSTAFSLTVNSPLGITAQPVASSVVCPGATVSASVSVTGTGPYSYQWYKGFNTPVASQTASTLTLSNVQTSDAGSYSVVVTGGCGSVTSTAFSLTVNALPTGASLTSGTLTCSQTSLTLTASATGATSYTLNGGAGSQTSTTGQFVVSTPGNYTVTVSNVSGCTATATATVTSNTAAPVATLSASSLSFCAGTSITLTAGTGTAYSFSGPGLSQSGASTTALATQGGTYSVVVTGANGCTASAGVSLSVTPATSITAPPASASTVCAGLPVSVSVGATGQNLTYQWYKGANPINGQTSSSLSFPAPQLTDAATYYVRVSGTCGPPQTSSFFTLTVNALPAPPTLSAISRTLYTSASPLSLTGFVTSTGNALSFSGVSGALPNPPTANISQAGQQSFSVSQTSASGCVSPATAFTLTILQSAPASQTVCRNSTVVVVAGAFGDRYEWYKNGQSAPFKLVEIASIQKGTASSSLTLVSVQTTASYYCKVIQASGSFVFTGPFVVTINYGCIAPGARQAAAVEGGDAGIAVVLTPNPVVEGRLRAVVRGAGGQALTVELVNLKGQALHRQQWETAASEQVVDWSVSQWPAGVYLLRAVSESVSGPARVTTLNVVKQE